MQKLDKIKEVKVAEQSIEVDPRSKTTADQAFNYIATGKPEMPIGSAFTPIVTPTDLSTTPL